MKRIMLGVQIGLMVGMLGVLGGCGGSEVPSVSASASGSGSGSASASGAITGFGSVFVNGKKYEADNVIVRMDDESEQSCSINPSNSCGLKKGMIVTVNGSFTGSQHTASAVRQKDAVEGLVQSIAVDGLSMVVMGQTVLVDATTVINDNIPGRNIVNLAAGTDHVEVNGHIRPNGVINATFIEKKAVGTVTPEVRGYVSGHTDGTKTFTIGALAVNYATAVINDMPTPNGNNWNGLLVEVKGTGFHAATTTLTATKVEPEQRGVGNNVDEFEVEGFVTQVLGSGDFFIGHTHVQTTSATEFRGGTIDEIVVGAKLSAEGRFANDILTVKHVKFHESVRLEGDIETIGPHSLTLRGLPGVTVTVNSQTEYKANGGTTLNTLNDLRVDDHVRVRGRITGTNAVIATRIQLRSADDDVDLQGPVQAVSDPHLTLLGVTVDTSSISDNEFKGVDESAVGRAAFFRTVKVGAVVKMKGRLAGSVVTWREVELEDETSH